MKRLLFLTEFLFALLFTASVFADVPIDSAHFPDATFRSFVSSNYDSNHDGILSTSEGDSAWICNCKEMGISSLKGVEYLTGIESLYCYKNNLTTLDVSKNTALQQLFCEENQLTSINVTGCRRLYQLRCYSNQLTSLNVRSNTALNYLNCSMNRISSIDTTQNTSLQNFLIFENNLITLDVSSNTRLEEFWCSSNKLTSLVLGNNDRLAYLSCYDNPFTRLDITNNRELRSLATVQYRHEEAQDYVYYMYDQKILRFGKSVELVIGDQIIPATTPASNNSTGNTNNDGNNNTNNGGNSSTTNNGGSNNTNSGNNTNPSNGNNTNKPSPTIKVSKTKVKYGKSTVKITSNSGSKLYVSGINWNSRNGVTIKNGKVAKIKFTKYNKRGKYTFEVMSPLNANFKGKTKKITIWIK